MPLTQDTLGFLQTAYTEAVRGFAALLGPLVIIDGCTPTAPGVYGPGVVAVNGEVLPCPGGSGTTVYIDDSPETVVFGDGSLRPVYHTRSLKFGIGAPTLNWAQFVRLERYPALQDALAAHAGRQDNPHRVTPAQLHLGAKTYPYTITVPARTNVDLVPLLPNARVGVWLTAKNIGANPLRLVYRLFVADLGMTEVLAMQLDAGQETPLLFLPLSANCTTAELVNDRMLSDSGLQATVKTYN